MKLHIGPLTARLIKLLAVLALCLVALFACGCETLQRPEEAAWQSLHMVDMIQTADGMRDSCVRESHPMTRQIIGEKPTTTGIAAYGLAAAGVHLLISDQLLERGYTRAYAVWQVISIADSAYAVGQNYGIGIRIGKPNKTGCQ